MRWRPAFSFHHSWTSCRDDGEFEGWCLVIDWLCWTIEIGGGRRDRTLP